MGRRGEEREGAWVREAEGGEFFSLKIEKGKGGVGLKERVQFG